MTSIAELLRKRANDLVKHLAAAIEGDRTGVHQGRVASRRLRESLPSAGRRTEVTKEARRAFREITRALGPVRELDVALGHLEDGLEGAKIPRIAVARVRSHVFAEREKRRQRMLAKLERVDVDGAIARVEQLARSASARMAPRRAEDVVSRVRARAAALAMAIDKAGTLYDPERLHSVRIATKKLRYALEVAVASSVRGLKKDLRLLKDAQESLGVMHDYQVLLEHVAAVSGRTPKGSPGAAGLKAMAAAYDRECRELHAIYLKTAPALAASATRLRNLAPMAAQSRK